MAYWWLFAGGLALLVLGSEAAVRGGVGLSRALGLPPLLIGLLIISTGTSAPEMSVALQAAHLGAPDIALGNVIGSNIINVLLILGLAAIIRPMPTPPKIVLRDGGFLFFVSIVLVVLAMSGKVTQEEGYILLAAYIVYCLVAFVTDWRRPSELSVHCARADEMKADTSAGGSLLLLAFGIACIALGGRLAVDGAIVFARDYGISQAMVGLTVMAVATSLPELMVISLTAARGYTQIAVGQLIGSNLFNTMAVIGATAATGSLPVAAVFRSADIYVMAGAAALLLPILLSGWRLSRPKGALLVLGYCSYALFLAWRQGLFTPATFGFG
jgi:cation:H+ antiporter